MRSPHPNKNRGPPRVPKLQTSKGLREMFEGDSADMFAGKFPLVSMGGRAEGLACADPRARTPIGASGILGLFSTNVKPWAT